MMKKILFLLSLTALLALQANAETTLRGDLNGDNEVNITDVNLLIEAISTGNGEASYDLNGDGAINITDLSILLEIAMAIDPEPDFEIEGEHAIGWWIVFSKIDGEKVWYQLHEGTDGCYVTTVTLIFSEYGYFYWDPDLSYEENEAHRPAAPFCFVIDGVRYGPSIPMMSTYVTSSKYYRWPAFSYGNPGNLLVKSNKYYTVPVGFAYVLGIGIDENGEYYVICVTGP